MAVFLGLPLTRRFAALLYILIKTTTRWRRGSMEKEIRSCGECLFYDERAMNPYFSIKMCRHPDNKKHLKISESIIHPNCPEGGEFVITTKKLDNETTTI